MHGCRSRFRHGHVTQAVLDFEAMNSLHPTRTQGLFELLAVMFFAVLPLVLLMKRARSGAAPSGAH